MLTTRKKQTAIKKTQIHDKDTGSPDAQVSILSKQIDELAKHLKKHPKDNHSRKGLLKMVADRQSLLKYVLKKDPKRHKKIIKSLELK
ncbi:30S ribosomal protein S15 [Candidatus Parcubacteria bacterium]|nr:30S ribosomal protein S15 [Candidatus Parcubacteria bacterium]